MKFIRNTHTFAFLQGLYERHRWGDGFGRSHATDEGWNDAYNRGANLSDYIKGNAA